MESFIEGLDSTVLVESGKVFTFSFDGVFNYQVTNSAFNGVYIDEVLAGELRFNGVAVTPGQFVLREDFDDLTWSTGAKTGTFEVITFRAANLAGVIDDDANTLSFELDVREVISGTKRSETVKGTNTRDIIDGGAGNDKLIGGQFDDIFRFKTGYDKDVIIDGVFESSASDVIDLSGLRSVKNYADLVDNHMRVRGDDVWIDGGKGDILILENVTLADLDKSDFIF